MSCAHHPHPCPADFHVTLDGRDAWVCAELFEQLCRDHDWGQK